MKKNGNTYSDYATNKGGRIVSPKGKPAAEPAAVRKSGDDLRVKKG